MSPSLNVARQRPYRGGLSLGLILAFLSTFLAAPLAAESPSSAVAAAPAAALSLDNGHYRVPGIAQLPAAAAKPVPGVVLLHGTGSNKNEVGNLYASLAERLAAQGIATLRIDFAGTGDSPVDYREYTLESARRDAQLAFDTLAKLPGVDPQRLGVVGFSQGGLIAQLLAAHEPRLRTMVTWSTITGDGVGDLAPFFAEHQAEAQKNGYARIEFPWRTPLNFSADWFTQVAHNTALSDMAHYQGRLLAIAGTDDTVASPSNSQRLVAALPATRAQLKMIGGADHIFHVLEPDGGQSSEVLTITTDWLAHNL
jgi:pimeloyl-ACP methyl ester carboxylesterase